MKITWYKVGDTKNRPLYRDTQVWLAFPNGDVALGTWRGKRRFGSLYVSPQGALMRANNATHWAALTPPAHPTIHSHDGTSCL